MTMESWQNVTPKLTMIYEINWYIRRTQYWALSMSDVRILAVLDLKHYLLWQHGYAQIAS